ncbi:hypothetical protein [Roseburia faecis]|jgi:hypothetical protein|uniref:hypothetical protein n=1 Tax=Roseburia faecis TaxID=301302 RepID=UPI001924AF22|nr:hypothetical protein [Roseburia faecis]DAS29920.1 MAG TPA: hypothetical protein [Caudoviricetes sp.]
MKQWKKERCSTRPKELELIAHGVYMQRRNIEAVEHEVTEEMEEYTDYVCDSREITESEYEMLKSIESINTDKAIEEYTLQLMQEGAI